ncbi:MAG: ZIP family metal transporter [Hyphococcus sp.]
MFGDDGVIYGLNASALAALISASGILSAAFVGEWVRKNSAYLSAFAVGLLTVAVLFHLIPEAIELSRDAMSWVAVGFALMVLVGIAVQAAVSGRAEGAALTFGYASIIALSAHSFLDGVIYAASFQEEPFTGWLATGGLLFHEFPEGVIAFFLLYQAGLSIGRSVITAFAAAGFTTFAGAVVANLILDVSGGLPLAAMLGGAAGGLIYVLIVHLGPHAASAPRKRGYPIAALGVMVGTAAVIINLLVDGHAH